MLSSRFIFWKEFHFNLVELHCYQNDIAKNVTCRGHYAMLHKSRTPSFRVLERVRRVCLAYGLLFISTAWRCCLQATSFSLVGLFLFTFTPIRDLVLGCLLIHIIRFCFVFCYICCTEIILISDWHTVNLPLFEFTQLYRLLV